MGWALILNLCQHLNLLLLLSIFHPSLRQAERAKLQVLLIIKCSILICTKGNFPGFLTEPHAVRERERRKGGGGWGRCLPHHQGWKTEPLSNTPAGLEETLPYILVSFLGDRKLSGTLGHPLPWGRSCRLQISLLPALFLPNAESEIWLYQELTLMTPAHANKTTTFRLPERSQVELSVGKAGLYSWVSNCWLPWELCPPPPASTCSLSICSAHCRTHQGGGALRRGTE